MVGQQRSDRAGESRASSTVESAGAGRPVAEKPRARTETAQPVVVERLTHQDIPAISALYKRVFEPLKPPLPPELLKTLVPTPLEFSSWMESVTYFAARRDGKMVGAIGCEARSAACRLVQIAVDPDARREGVGSALVRAAIDWARHSNANSVWIELLPRFEDAADLFTHLGFVVAGVLHRHQMNEDVRFFEKLL